MLTQASELKALRKATGLTQEGLGEAIGLSRLTVGLMERGTTPIDRRTRLAVYLEVARDRPLIRAGGGIGDCSRLRTRPSSEAAVNGADLADPTGKLGGNGKLMRHMPLTRVEQLNDPAVRELLVAARVERKQALKGTT